MGKREIAHWQAIDQTVVGQGDESLRRPAHCEMGRPQDVQAVDLVAIGSRNRPGDLRISGQKFVECLAFWRADLFGIIQPGAGKAGRQNHGGCRDRPCERAAASFVNACDPLNAAGLKSGFKGEIRHGSESVESLAR